MTWSGPDGREVSAPEPPDGPFYEPIGDWQGAAYDRNAFARGTQQEVAFLVDALALVPEHRILDVGCGTGRHSRHLAELGFSVTGVDISAGLLRAARESMPGTGAAWVRADARRLPFAGRTFDVVLSLCQGGFGITPAGDRDVVAEMHRVLRSPGKMALTAFSLEFAVRWMSDGDAIDVSRGLHHHRAQVRNADGATKRFDLWTRCYAAPEIRQLLEETGMEVDSIFGVQPGGYTDQPPRLDLPEHLLIAHKR